MWPYLNPFQQQNDNDHEEECQNFTDGFGPFSITTAMQGQNEQLISSSCQQQNFFQLEENLSNHNVEEDDDSVDFRLLNTHHDAFNMKDKGILNDQMMISQECPEGMPVDEVYADHDGKEQKRNEGYGTK